MGKKDELLGRVRRMRSAGVITLILTPLLTSTVAAPTASAQVAPNSDIAGRYDSSVLADAPVAYWKLREASPDTASFPSNSPILIADTRGGKSGTLEGAAKLGVAPGPFPGTTALSTPGGRCDGVNLNEASSVLTSPAVTVEAWVRSTQPPVTDRLGTIFRWRYSGYHFAAAPAGIRFSTDQRGPLAETTALSDNKWHHLVGSYDPAIGFATYLDGELAASAPAVGPIQFGTQTGGTAIGRDGSACDDVVPSFAGDIANVAMYNRYLSPSSVRAHAQASAVRLPETAKVTSPDYKVVRYIRKFSIPSCAKSAAANAVPDFARACPAIWLTHNPVPKPGIAATNASWDAFLASKEYRSVLHLPSYELECSQAGFVTGRPKALTPPQLSAGWTPVRGPRRTSYVAGEKYDGGGGIWYQVDPVMTLSTDQRSVHLAYRIAARAGTAENLGSTIAGLSLPFVWTMIQMDLRCDGTAPTTVTYSDMPSISVYKNGKFEYSDVQTNEWGRFFKSGGTNRPVPGKGKLSIPCRAQTFDVAASFLPYSPNCEAATIGELPFPGGGW